MTQRISSLLQEAVAGIELAQRDPVAAVLRRDRAARRRTAITAAVLCAGLAAGAAAVTGRMVESRHLPPAGVAATGLPRIRLADGALIAGAVRLPVPAGWQVHLAPDRERCDRAARTIAVLQPGGSDCVSAEIEIWPTEVPFPETGQTEINSVSPPIIHPPVVVTLPGGEPALLAERPGPATTTPVYPGHLSGEVAKIVLPWSNLFIWARTDGPSVRALLGSIQTTPTAAGALTVPATATAASFTVADTTGRVDLGGHAVTTDRETIGRVLDLLRDQKDVVGNTEACAGDGQRVARIDLHPVGAPTSPTPAGTAPSAPAGTAPSTPAGAAPTSVLIALGDTCQEALSTDGGRVRLSDETVGDLKSLFGIGIR